MAAHRGVARYTGWAEGGEGGRYLANCQQRNANFPVASAAVFRGPAAVPAGSCRVSLQQRWRKHGHRGETAETELMIKSHPGLQRRQAYSNRSILDVYGGSGDRKRTNLDF